MPDTYRHSINSCWIHDLMDHEQQFEKPWFREIKKIQKKYRHCQGSHGSWLPTKPNLERQAAQQHNMRETGKGQDIIQVQTLSLVQKVKWFASDNPGLPLSMRHYHTSFKWVKSIYLLIISQQEGRVCLVIRYLNNILYIIYRMKVQKEN